MEVDKLKPGYYETRLSVTFNNTPQRRSSRQDEATRTHKSRQEEEDRFRQDCETQDVSFAHNVLELSEISADLNTQKRYQQKDRENYLEPRDVAFVCNDSEPAGINATLSSIQQQDEEIFFQAANIDDQESLVRGHGLPPCEVEQNTKATKLQPSPFGQAHFNRYHWEKGTRKGDSSWKSVPQVILHGVPKDVRFFVLTALFPTKSANMKE